MNTAANLPVGTRVQHIKSGKVGTVVTTFGTDSAAVRVAWDGARGSIVYGESVRVM